MSAYYTFFKLTDKTLFKTIEENKFLLEKFYEIKKQHKDKFWERNEKNDFPGSTALRYLNALKRTSVKNTSNIEVVFNAVFKTLDTATINKLEHLLKEQAKNPDSFDFSPNSSKRSNLEILGNELAYYITK